VPEAGGESWCRCATAGSAGAAQPWELCPGGAPFFWASHVLDVQSAGCAMEQQHAVELTCPSALHVALPSCYGVPLAGLDCYDDVKTCSACQSSYGLVDGACQVR